MQSAGAGRGQADAEAPGCLGVAAGHEGGRLLVVDEDETDPGMVAAQGLHDPVDAIAGQPEDHVDIPVHQCLDQNVRGCLRHVVLRESE